MSLGSMQRRKECDSDARRLWIAGVPMIFVFLLLAWESAEEKGGHKLERKDRYRDRWKDERMTCGLYILLSLPLASYRS